MKPEDQLYFTLYFNDAPPLEGLKPLSFMSGSEERIRRNEYYHGYGTLVAIPKRKIEDELSKGFIKELRLEMRFKGGEKRVLWMDSNCGVWAADADQPFSDRSKELVYVPVGYKLPGDLKASGARIKKGKKINGWKFKT